MAEKPDPRTERLLAALKEPWEVLPELYIDHHTVDVCDTCGEEDSAETIDLGYGDTTTRCDFCGETFYGDDGRHEETRTYAPRYIGPALDDERSLHLLFQIAEHIAPGEVVDSWTTAAEWQAGGKYGAGIGGDVVKFGKTRAAALLAATEARAGLAKWEETNG